MNRFANGETTTYEWSSSEDVRRLRHAVASLIEGGGHWRRHGIGCLQAYVSEGESYEQRIHVWSPKLMLPGIAESGNAHNHRFDLVSTVLHGKLGHEAWTLTEEKHYGLYETYDFIHARLQTEDTRADMRRTGKRFYVSKKKHVFEEGQRYYFARGAFHASTCESELVVTLVEKLNQAEERALVIAPVNLAPVPAFGGDPVPADLQREILRDAVRVLRS